MIIKSKKKNFLDEIKDLNCKLNNFKNRINRITFDYDQLLNDYYYLQSEKIFQIKMPDNYEENEEEIVDNINLQEVK